MHCLMKNLNHDAWTRSCYVFFFFIISENFAFNTGGIPLIILKLTVTLEYSKSKGKIELKTNELSFQTGRHSTGKQLANNPSGLQRSLQRTSGIEFGSQTFVTDELLDFRTEMVSLTSCFVT